mmetsp:Transcript_6599/g.16211  ORF Transcript_6599/g.16211 Transcript_6599/m.16211 type:complete len:201 (+) Transcript_6599:674-1276(+)
MEQCPTCRVSSVDLVISTFSFFIRPHVVVLRQQVFRHELLLMRHSRPRDAAHRDALPHEAKQGPRRSAAHAHALLREFPLLLQHLSYFVQDLCARIRDAQLVHEVRVAQDRFARRLPIVVDPFLVFIKLLVRLNTEVQAAGLEQQLDGLRWLLQRLYLGEVAERNGNGRNHASCSRARGGPGAVWHLLTGRGNRHVRRRL